MRKKGTTLRRGTWIASRKMKSMEKKAEVKVERIQVVSANTGRHSPDVYGITVEMLEGFTSKAKVERVRKAVEKALNS